MSPTPGRLAAEAALYLTDVLAATAGELVHPGRSRTFGGVTTDSRTIEPGELFVAIRGETHDGHAFLADAVARGAGGLVVETDVAIDAAVTIVRVRETLAALGDIALFHRRLHPVPLVAVAGSNGKTTTKEMLATILRAAYGESHVVATRGSQNNLVGLPLTLLRVGDQTRVVVLEIGMNAPGEVWRLAEIARPDVGLITCIAEEHLAGVGSIRGAAEANAELWRRMRPSGTAIVNADDPHLRDVAHAFDGRRVSFGDGGDVHALDVVDQGIDGTRFVLATPTARREVRLEVAGRHNVSNALAATAAALAVGVPLETACRALETFSAPTMRMQRLTLASGVVVLNDCYNANPGSMAAAIQTLAASHAPRRFAVLGEMLELGASAESAHREVGRLAGVAGVNGLFLIGTHAALVRDAAVAAGLPAERVAVAGTHDALADALRGVLEPGDLVLLKGSRGAAMEKVLRRLEPERSA